MGKADVSLSAVEGFNSSISSANETIESVRSTISSGVDAAVSAAESEASSLQGVASECSSTISDYQNQINDLKEQLQSIKAQLENTPPEIESDEVDEEGNPKKKPNPEYQRLKLEESRIEGEISSLEAAISSLNSLNSDINQALSEINSVISNLQSTMSAIESALSGMTENCQTAQQAVTRILDVLAKYLSHNFSTCTSSGYSGPSMGRIAREKIAFNYIFGKKKTWTSLLAHEVHAQNVKSCKLSPEAHFDNKLVSFIVAISPSRMVHKMDKAQAKYEAETGLDVEPANQIDPAIIEDTYVYRTSKFVNKKLATAALGMTLIAKRPNPNINNPPYVDESHVLYVDHSDDDDDWIIQTDI